MKILLFLAFLAQQVRPGRQRAQQPSDGWDMGLFLACYNYGRDNVPGWRASQENGAYHPALVQLVYGNIQHGMCRGYMSIGPPGHRRDVLVFTLVCERGTCG